MEESLFNNSAKPRDYGSSIGTNGLPDTGEGMEHKSVELEHGQFRNFGFEGNRELSEVGVVNKVDGDRKGIR